VLHEFVTQLLLQVDAFVACLGHAIDDVDHKMKAGKSKGSGKSKGKSKGSGVFDKSV
jgi:hypothetical protein